MRLHCRKQGLNTRIAPNSRGDSCFSFKSANSVLDEAHLDLRRRNHRNHGRPHNVGCTPQRCHRRQSCRSLVLWCRWVLRGVPHRNLLGNLCRSFGRVGARKTGLPLFTCDESCCAVLSRRRRVLEPARDLPPADEITFTLRLLSDSGPPGLCTNPAIRQQ